MTLTFMHFNFRGSANYMRKETNNSCGRQTIPFITVFTTVTVMQLRLRQK